jgi:tetratricopeptide (TPR) repeat protein
MTDNDPTTTGAGGDGRDPEDLESVLAGYVERLNTGERISPWEIERDHPHHAQELIEQLEVFQDGVLAQGDQEPLGTLGDYTLRRQIGRGGMGVVYEAWQNSLDRQVALKVLPAGVATDDRAFQRFMREAKTAAKLQHPHIVGVYGMGVEQNTPYYAMEFVGGETLAQLLTRISEAASETETPFGPKDQVDYFAKLARAFAEVADGLQHAHSKGVIHRDIKPSNLILDGEGRLRILDFGLARLEGQESLTLTGDFLGTPLYMSPEQARRKKIPVDHRTDIYSLGATLYEMLALRPPFEGKDHGDTLSQIIEREPIELRKLNPRIPRDLETIVLKCLRKDPADRYGTAEALGQDLRRFVRGDPIEARPQGVLERAMHRLWVRRLPLSFAGIALALAALLMVLASSWIAEARRSSTLRYDELVAESQRTVDLALALKASAVVQERSTSPFLDWSTPFTRELPERRLRQLLARAESILEEARALLPSRNEASLELQRVRNIREADLTEIAKSERTRLTHGIDLLLAGDQDQARLELAMARGSLPTSPAPVMLIAQSYVLDGNAEAADTWLERSFWETAPQERADLAMSIAEFWFTQRAVNAAAPGHSYPERVRRWLERVPDSLQKLQALLISSENPQEALAAGIEALTLAPNDPVTHCQLASLYAWSLADFSQAEEHAKRSLAASSQDPGLLTTLGQVWYELGRHHQAIAAGKAAVALRPDSARPLLVIAMSMVMLGECEEAAKVYRKVLASHPRDSGTMGYLSGALAAMGKLEEGLGMALEAVRIEPESPAAHCFLGQRYMGLGKMEEATKSYDRALALDPSSRWAMWAYANACLQKGDFDKCLALLCDAIPRAASALHTSSGARQNFCRILRGIPKPKDLGPLDGFIERIEGRTAEANDPPIVLEGLALAYLHAPQRRNLERAQAYATRAVEASRWQSADALATLASVHFVSGRIGEAIRMLEDHVDAERREGYRDFLQQCRRELRPDLASFSSVDALLASDPANSEVLRAALEAFEELESTPERRATAAYFRARLLEKDGLCAEAADAFVHLMTDHAGSVSAQIPRIGQCIGDSEALSEALGAVCQAALAAPAPDGVLYRSLSAVNALASPGDEIPGVGRVHVWWIVGPLENADSVTEGLDESQPVDLHHPLRRDDKVLAWRRHLSASVDVDLSEICGPLKKALALLYAELLAPSATDVQLMLEVDDQVSLSLNGTELYRFEGVRMALPRQHVIAATLQRGINRLLLKVRNISGDWGVSLRIEDRDGLPVRLLQQL